ncbi:tRNA threonylcarbamoyladenosine dehydratase [Sulfuriferula nivalis]|uniref:tRNA threonylcarbamoyladenosine dehydratase n=1 Tax=Sulfuriferula nivalis TaxID=2675298 RepID=A0A809SBC1_9PROT|nr:tRNA threonylcarbamoyladenosine dehydratase [Sulfuriferula nivalis]BBP02192.1 tRNA threonylcarbamoyladenosine dehydratase [Sulfuriferula nivalis]
MTTVPQFERTEILIGQTGIATLASKHIFVAGLGGVGSYCAEALARAGIGRITLVDHDHVAPSNINRQLPALLSTIGLPKIDIMRERIMNINPACKLTTHQVFLTTENMLDYVPADADYVIDCIDSLNCKVALVSTSLQRGLNVASSMGAGNRLEPSMIKLADISKTEMCPLARIMRKRLHKLGIRKGILTVYSDEQPADPLPPVAVDGPGRARAVNGTISYMPPLFGLMLAGEVIRRLLASQSTSTTESI